MLAFGVLVRQVDAAEPARTELPGFSMVLPPGDVLEQSRLPVTGTYKLAVSSDAKFEAPYDQLDRAQLLPRGRQVVVSWMAVAHTTDEWRLYVQAIANSIGTPATIGRDESAGGRRVTLIELPSFSLGVGAAVCEDKFTVVVIWAMSRDAAQQFMGARAAVNSVQCKLTPENLRPFEAAVTLPRGFSRDATEEGQVYTSRQGEQLVVSYTGQDVQRHGPKLRDIITNLFAAAGGFSDLRLSDVATAPVAGRPESLFRFESKDMEAGYVAALYCPAFDVTFISIWTGPKPSDELALQRLRAVACPAEDGAKH